MTTPGMPGHQHVCNLHQGMLYELNARTALPAFDVVVAQWPYA